MEEIIKNNKSLISAVPAIHYRAVFAREVNHLCYRDETRPDAIAVELGPHIVREITGLMKELGVSPLGEVELPCMVGILVKNTLIHPDYQETALQLQENIGKPLNEISKELLKHLLHFSDDYLIALSSTDSIIEAIRCAIELDIPVYGVDMDEFSSKADKCVLVEEPSASVFNLSHYVSNYAGTASKFRDPYVDGRREYVMAARLKCISGLHKRILFTGGLAHWEMIKNLMKDQAVRPADFLIPDISMNFTRVIVHPKMAVAFMDNYPALSTIYEQNRHKIVRNSSDPFYLPDLARVHQEILCEVYKKYFNERETEPQESKEVIDGQKICDFERLLAYMQILHQKIAPSIHDLLECARSMMPQAFLALLTAKLMDLGRPWASHRQFPDLPLIYRMSEDHEERENNSPFYLIQMAEDGKFKKLYQSPRLKKSGAFNLECYQINLLPENIFSLWQWEDEPKQLSNQRSHFDWVWPPCEALLFGSAFEASKIIAKRLNEPIPTPFEGSIYEGLDIKSTIRSEIAGEKKIYVKKPSFSKRENIPDGKMPEPMVILFDSGQSAVNSTWSLLIAGTNPRSYVKDKLNYDEIVRKFGGYFISSIGRIINQEAPPEINRYVVSYGMLEGITEFGNPCINAKQGGQWLQDNNFRSCPVLKSTSINAMVDYYKMYHNMDISESDWKTALIRFAIPYAKERILVIAPRNFKLSSNLNSEARKRNVYLDLLSLDYFSNDRIAEMRQRILVRANDTDGFSFQPEVEKALGQKVDKYFEMLPLYMQKQITKT